MSDKIEDRMASVPLMNLHERRSGNGSSPVNEPDWSDQELEEFSRDPLESVLMQMRLWPQSITRQQCVRASVFSSTISLCVGFAAAFVLLIVLYPPSTCVRFLKEDPTIFSKLLKTINIESLQLQLKNVTQSPHLAGSSADKILTEYILQQWLEHGLEDVKSVPYTVNLPQANNDTSNKVTIIDSNSNSIILEAKLDYVPNNATYIPSFHAYSGLGSVQGDLVFANYGTPDDYVWLKQKNVNVSNKILLIRHGKIPTYTKVHMAELNNARGVILYPDPKDFAPRGRKHVFPETTSLPGTAVHSGTLQYNYFPGVQCNECSPDIPVQSISYDDAEQFLSRMAGEFAPPSWNGSLNVRYRVGPGFEPRSHIVNLTVGLKLANVTAANIFGKIEGRTEPDRYIIVGSHRDAWGFGGVDPGSGLAVQLQLSQALGKLIKSGWRPHRTILFCNWGAGAYGSSGVANWIQDYNKVLDERAVVYLNVDMAVQGNFALRAVTVPSLKKLLYLTAEKIPNPDPEENNAGSVSVIGTWASKLPDNTSLEGDNPLPRVFSPGYNTDYNHFMYTLGVPIVDMSYASDASEIIETYPLHNTAIDSFQLVSKSIDPEFKYHLAMAQMWGELIRSFSDSLLLPFKITDYAISLNDSCVELHQTYRILSASNRIEFDTLQSAIQNFSTAAEAFDSEVKNLDLHNPYSVRSANDRMMLAERAFIVPQGLSCQPNLKHVVWSPDMFHTFKGQSFMCLRLYFKWLFSAANNQEMYVRKIKEELQFLASSVNSAAFALSTTM